ncbi:helix-turn-helix domain-containing protein [Actinosynnema sp. CA-248983]
MGMYYRSTYVGGPITPPSTHVGKLIERGLQQSGVADRSELAARCGVHRSYITRLSRGKIQYLSEPVLIRLAAVLDQDPEDYRIAIMMDRTRYDSWERVMVSELALHEGVRLRPEDIVSIRHYVLGIMWQRRHLARSG